MKNNGEHKRQYQHFSLESSLTNAVDLHASARNNYKFKMWPSFFMWIRHLIFNSEALAHNFPQFIHRFKIWVLKFCSWAVYTFKFFPIHKKDAKLKFLKSLDCTSKFSPFHWNVWKLRFLSPCLHILSNGEDGLRHVASHRRSQFMIKLAVFKKKCQYYNVAR